MNTLMTVLTATNQLMETSPALILMGSIFTFLIAIMVIGPMLMTKKSESGEM